jgi:hypothetical protein
VNLERQRDLSKARVLDMKLWRHKDHYVDRDEAVARLSHRFVSQIKAAKKRDLNLAPVLGIACPGVIVEDGSITRGTQNLPGKLGKQQIQSSSRHSRRATTDRSP